MKKFFLIVFLFILTLFASYASIEDRSIQWETWTNSVFEKAKTENKFVILDLEAVWCHWCHVMQEETYKDPGVIELIKSHFIPVRVDQDSRPDLSNRYREYGWPATIVFNSKGEEIIKRAGYITPDEMKIELQKIIDDPTPEEPSLNTSNIKYSNNAFLSKELKNQLIKNHKSWINKNIWHKFKCTISYAKYYQAKCIHYVNYWWLIVKKIPVRHFTFKY